jgi:hypothetical protein
VVASLIGCTLALLLVAVLAWVRLVPPAAVGLGLVFWLRGCWLVSARRPAWPASRIGAMEAGLGTLQVGVLAVAYASLVP